MSNDNRYSLVELEMDAASSWLTNNALFSAQFSDFIMNGLLYTNLCNVCKVIDEKQLEWGRVWQSWGGFTPLFNSQAPLFCFRHYLRVRFVLWIFLSSLSWLRFFNHKKKGQLIAFNNDHYDNSLENLNIVTSYTKYRYVKRPVTSWHDVLSTSVIRLIKVIVINACRCWRPFVPLLPRFDVWWTVSSVSGVGQRFDFQSSKSLWCEGQ